MNFDSIFGQWKHFKVSCRKQTECAPVLHFTFLFVSLHIINVMS